MVKTPVTYNSTIFTINDADADLLIDLEVTIPRASDIVCGEYTDEVVTKMNSIGNQIANALNTATDQSRVIEELTADRDALRREVEAGKVRERVMALNTLDAVLEFINHPDVKPLRDALPVNALEQLAEMNNLRQMLFTLEGESR